MSVAAYDRFLERATRWGFDSARLRQHLRTAFAACLAVFAAWALGLERRAALWLAKGLAYFNNFTLAPVLILIFVVIGILADRN